MRQKEKFCRIIFFGENLMKKNLVVIGYGGIGSGLHCKNALKSDAVNLKGIYDIDPKKAETAAERGIYAYSSLDEVLSDPTVDLVTVAIPNDSHKEVVVKALLAGKNVICEKPVALSSEDLEEMIAASKTGNALFTVHQNRRFDVDYLAIQKLIDENTLGAPLRIESRIHGSRGIPSDWRGTKAQGGGMILDWGVHLIDQLLLAFKGLTITSIYCETTHITNDEVDDGCYLTITFENGAKAMVEVGTYNFIPLPRFYMKAEKGTALISDWREEAKCVRCKYWHESEVVPVETAAGLTKTMAPRDSVTVDEFTVPRPVSDVHDFYRNFCKAIDGECCQMVTHAEMRRVLRVMEEAFRSAETGEVIKTNI